MECEKQGQTARKTRTEFPPMALIDWLELAPDSAVVPDFDSQAETAEVYCVPPSLPPGSSATTRRTAKEHRTQTFHDYHSGNYNEGILHQGLPLLTPLGLVDGKQDKAYRRNPDYDPQQAKHEFDDTGIDIRAKDAVGLLFRILE
jgi:hypothetical protein